VGERGGGRPPRRAAPLLGVDDVVGRRDDGLEAADAVDRVVEGVEGLNVGHEGGGG
jgi:hypothetical protein